MAKPANQLVPHEKVDILPPDIMERIEEAKKQNQALMLLMKELLQEGVDYGRVKGVPKPFLHQPGAQQLCLIFKMRPVFEKIDSILDFDREPAYISFEYKCKLYHRESDMFLGEGVGSANSYERKYRYLKDGTEVKDPLDKQNTLVKMAKKRAFVDAVLNVTGASRLFTQDEDLMDEYDVEQTTENGKQDPGEVVLTFGKHKGKKLKDIPDHYLQWVAKNSKDEKMKKTAQEYLNNKQKSNGTNQKPKNGKKPERELTEREKEIKDLIDNDTEKRQIVIDFLRTIANSEGKEKISIDELSDDEYAELLALISDADFVDDFEEPEEEQEDEQMDFTDEDNNSRGAKSDGI